MEDNTLMAALATKSDAQLLAELRAVCAQFEKNAEGVIALAHLALQKARRER